MTKEIDYKLVEAANKADLERKIFEFLESEKYKLFANTNHPITLETCIDILRHYHAARLNFVESVQYGVIYGKTFSNILIKKEFIPLHASAKKVSNLVAAIILKLGANQLDQIQKLIIFTSPFVETEAILARVIHLAFTNREHDFAGLMISKFSANEYHEAYINLENGLVTQIRFKIRNNPTLTQNLLTAKLPKSFRLNLRDEGSLFYDNMIREDFLAVKLMFAFLTDASIKVVYEQTKTLSSIRVLNHLIEENQQIDSEIFMPRNIACISPTKLSLSIPYTRPQSSLFTNFEEVSELHLPPQDKFVESIESRELFSPRSIAIKNIGRNKINPEAFKPTNKSNEQGFAAALSLNEKSKVEQLEESKANNCKSCVIL